MKNMCEGEEYVRHLQETVGERGLLDDRDMFAYSKRPIVYLALCYGAAAPS